MLFMALLLLAGFPGLNLHAQDGAEPSQRTFNFPRLESLNNQDPIFRQISDDIQSFYRWQAGNDARPQLSIYEYVVQEGDSMFSLAARLNIPQASIATLNRLDNPRLPLPGTPVLIPNIPGMFIPENPESDFQRMLSSRIKDDGSFELSEQFTLPPRAPGKDPSSWRFVLNGDFTGVERRAFLQVLFRDPLPGSYISSGYGLRTSPFTGRNQFHFGIDLVAPMGTSVVSAMEGRVLDVGEDRVYGKYISIEHPSGYQTMYAHLGNIFVGIGDTLKAGDTIASVGNSGLSTGAHLHFEIMYLGKNRDPQEYIRR
ncbi:LysM peptidoglycan-binding domain-containing M23 family metallopeptidase [Salinispira pacifica]|nr:M23 family metallopeptidase [Salinispira pacifica]